jgi:hypothetical protein
LSEISQARNARPSMVTARAYRRPCRKWSSSGPITGASSANGTIVISRYSATLLRASPSGTLKKMVPANPIAISVSPAQEMACRSKRRTMPTSLAAPRARTVPTVRVAQAPPRTEPRTSTRIPLTPVPIVRPMVGSNGIPPS